MSIIWSFMICVSIIVALFSGNPESVINSIMGSSSTAIENVIKLIGMMCFWAGIFNIFSKTNSVKQFSKIFNPLINKLFKKEELSDKAVEYISMNISTNIIGVGNASTINGIKSMEEMQKVNHSKDRPNDSMTTFVLLNTASLQLIPTNMIALRTLYGSNAPSSIVIPIWIVTGVALCVGILSIKILNKKM